MQLRFVYGLRKSPLDPLTHKSVITAEEMKKYFKLPQVSIQPELRATSHCQQVPHDPSLHKEEEKIS